MDRQQQLIQILSERIAATKTSLEQNRTKQHAKQLAVALSVSICMLLMTAYDNAQLTDENQQLETEILSAIQGDNNSRTLKAHRASGHAATRCDGLIQSIGSYEICRPLPI